MEVDSFVVVRGEVDDIGVDVGVIFPAFDRYYFLAQVIANLGMNVVEVYPCFRVAGIKNCQVGDDYGLPRRNLTFGRRDVYTIFDFVTLIRGSGKVVFNGCYLPKKEVRRLLLEL